MTASKTTTPRNPTWWTDAHSSAWEHVKGALERDWEQTKADLTSRGGTRLNQGITDTIKQACGADVPPLDVKTRPTELAVAASHEQKAFANLASVTQSSAAAVAAAQSGMAQERAQLGEKASDALKVLTAKEEKTRAELVTAGLDAGDKVAGVRVDMAVDAMKTKMAVDGIKSDLALQSAKAYEKIADVKRDLAAQGAKASEKIVDARDALAARSEEGSEKIAAVEVDMAAARLDAKQTVAGARVTADDTIAAAKEKAAAGFAKGLAKMDDAHAKRDEAFGEWRDAEQDVRYGYAMRSRYSQTAWTDELDGKAQREWDALETGRTWAESRYGVRRGFEYAASH